MSRIIVIILLVSFVLVMLIFVIFAISSKPKVSSEDETFGTGIFPYDAVRKQNQAKDAVSKADVGQLAIALQSYFTKNSSYPSQSQGFSQLVVSREFKIVPTPQLGDSYKYLVGPEGCLGTKSSPCINVAVAALLFEPTTAGSVWCWQSKTGRAQEVAASECTP